MIPETYKILVDSWWPGHGMIRHENRNGANVLRIHHSSDPTKDDAWAEAFAKTLPGGRGGGSFRAEYDMEADANAGGRVFPDFTVGSHVIPPLVDLPEEWPKWRVIDPGLEHALACCWYTLDPFNRMLIKYDEHVQAGWPDIERHASVIKGKTGKTKIEYTLIDPSAFAKTLQGGGRSVSDIFASHGIFCCPAPRSSEKQNQIAALGDLILIRGIEPRFKVTANCQVSIEELLKYRWMPKLHEDKDSPQKPVKKDDDCVDCDLYMASALDPEKASQRWAERDPMKPWYNGLDRRRIMADTRRMRDTASRGMLEEDP